MVIRSMAAQSNRLETDFSLAMRSIASPSRLAMEMRRIFGHFRMSSVAAIESVTTRDFSLESRMRATAPPDSTPWVA